MIFLFSQEIYVNMEETITLLEKKMNQEKLKHSRKSLLNLKKSKDKGLFSSIQNKVTSTI